MTVVESAETRRRAAVGRDDFRDFMSGFATGVTIVTSLSAAGERRGMTVSSLASVTLEPPTLLVCLRNGSATLDTVEETGRFAVHLLRASAAATATRFATADMAERFHGVHCIESPLSGLPLLTSDAFAIAECATTGSLAIGDHRVVLGTPYAISTVAEPAPLLYGRRRYFESGPIVATQASLGTQ